jgi:hypothetical protein
MAGDLIRTIDAWADFWVAYIQWLDEVTTK